MDNKTNQATRVLRIIDLLKGRSTSGLSNKVISESLGESPVNISRALAILMQEGFVTKLDNGFYALSVKVTQIGVTHLTEIDNAQVRLNQLKQRSAVLLG